MATTTFLPEAIEKAKSMFNGYWAWDYEMCDRVANEYGYNKSAFQTAVYKTI